MQRSILELKKYFRVNRKSEFGCHKVLYKLITFDLQEFMTVVKWLNDEHFINKMTIVMTIYTLVFFRWCKFD